MDVGTQLFIWFAGTVLLTRIFLFLHPMESPTIRGFRMHHWMYGAAGIPLSMFVVSLPIFGVSLGLFVDELMLIMIHKHLGKEGSAAYHSLPSMGGALLFVLVIFFLKDLFAAYFS